MVTRKKQNNYLSGIYKTPKPHIIYYLSENKGLYIPEYPVMQFQ